MAVPADKLMSFLELAQAAGGRMVLPGKAGFFSSVAVDSREMQEGGLFVALEGQKQDGHDFLEAALKAGASGALVSESRLSGLERIALPYGAALVAVPRTLRALQDAAGAYLKKFPRLLKIGITGSSGKTTTKEIAACLLGEEMRVFSNRGNMNSETGLPLSVFEVRDFHQAGIFELGMNRRGEIAEGAAVLRPDIALVTNVGTAHIGMIGSREGIALEKKGIFSQFSGGELALIPGEDPMASILAQGVRGRIVFYGKDRLKEPEGIEDLGLEGYTMIWEGCPVKFPLPGKHNLKNALAAAAIAEAAGLSGSSISRGLERVKPLFGRGEIFRGPVTVVRDCYNANPESARAAIAFCDSLPWEGRRIYVLGSMLELGEMSAEAHRAMGEVLSSSGADLVCLYGEEWAPAVEGMGLRRGAEGVPVFHTQAMDALREFLETSLVLGDLVLLKGSRGCALERLSEGLTGFGRGRA
jgi:UDP-N-acetylmuramoyl-tripeptide--D-alanyl-D-alanine ligase